MYTLDRRMIGKRLKHLRTKKGDTQEELADAIGVSKTQIYRWETDDNDPTGDKIIELARHFSVTTDFLLGLVTDPNAHLTESDLSAVERQMIADLRTGQLAEALEAFARLSKRDDQAGVA